MNNAEKTAFANEPREEWSSLHGRSITIRNPGLTKREYFAGLAMQGFASAQDCGGTIEDVAEFSVRWADALLAELEK